DRQAAVPGLSAMVVTAEKTIRHADTRIGLWREDVTTGTARPRLPYKRLSAGTVAAAGSRAPGGYFIQALLHRGPQAVDVRKRRAVGVDADAARANMAAQCRAHRGTR